MAIYVDELRDYQYLMGARVPGLWCHMVTDGRIEELHEFAMLIGLSRRRFQDHPRHPHYDLMASSRALAIACGAIAVNTRQMARIVRK